MVVENVSWYAILDKVFISGKIGKMERVYLLLGTNIGDLKENLTTAIDELNKNNIRVIKKSKIYRTKPWGKAEQPDFLNMALEVETSYSPQRLLQKIKEIEEKMKREKTERWGPRIIDIDILFYGTETINEPELTIPHPHFFKRAFAIIPLAEIAPDYIPPSGSKSIREIASGVENEGVAVYSD